jgi:hypothetical protein
LSVSEEIFKAMGLQLVDWGETLEQQIDAIIALAIKTPVMSRFPGALKAQRVLYSSTPRNLNFAEGLLGWQTSAPREAYDFQVDSQTVFHNKNSLAITLLKTASVTSQRATLTHEGFLADHYRGQRVRMISYVRAEAVYSACFSIRVINVTTQQDGEKTSGSITTTQQRLSGETHDWKRYEAIFDVPSDATLIIGFELWMQGKVWLDGIQLECVEKNVPVTGTSVSPYPLQPVNLDFTQGLENWHLEGSFAQDYNNGVDDAATSYGTASAYLKADRPEPRGTALLIQTVSTENYQNKRLCFCANIKTLGVTQQAGLYIHTGSEIEVRMTSIQGTTGWTRQELICDVPMGSSIDFGLILHGSGQAWLDSPSLEIVEPLA